MKRHFKKYWFIYLLIFLFIAFVVVCLFNREFYLYLFDSPDHKFQWVGATSIIAIITLAVNAWDNRRKFKADLISKSRLEWINDVRSRTASFIEACYEEDCEKTNEYGSLLRLHFSYDQKNQENAFSKAKNEDEIVINEKLLKKLMSKKNNNNKNVLINSYINNMGRLILEKEVPDLKKKYQNKKIFKIAFDGSIKEHKKVNIWGIFLSNFIEIIRLYLKIEWERAKKGE